MQETLRRSDTLTLKPLWFLPSPTPASILSTDRAGLLPTCYVCCWQPEELSHLEEVTFPEAMAVKREFSTGQDLRSPRKQASGHVCKIFKTEVTEVGRYTLNMGGTISWDRAQAT